MIKQQDVKNSDISTEEGINYAREVEESDKNDDDFSPDDTKSNPEEEEEDKLDVFEILKLLLSDM
ncbi:MAG: hypothetical protein MRK02_02765 [Candidatus Scalindua sp.]|nr:hypothetical protein [Candidatus Scalindua sp.]